MYILRVGLTVCLSLSAINLVSGFHLLGPHEFLRQRGPSYYNGESHDVGGPTLTLQVARIEDEIKATSDQEDDGHDSTTLSVQVPSQSQPFSCNFCHTHFPSRNAVFRHLRMDGCSSSNPRCPSNSTEDPIVKQSIAIQFGYVNASGAGMSRHSLEAVSINQHNDTNTIERSLNEWAGEQVFQAVQHTLDNYDQEKKKYHDNKLIGDDESSAKLLDFRLQESRTQSSVARLRSRILQQDPNTSAATDVLVITGTCLQSSLPQLEVALSELPDTLFMSRHQHPLQNAHPIVKIWNCKLLHSDVVLHAERSCTQIVYHYLVPLSWMPDAEILQKQWLGWRDKPPADGLRLFKEALRHAESGMVPRTITTETETTIKGKKGKVVATKPSSGSDQQFTRKMAVGRFGRLGAKERKAWHNFASPRLRGQAAPNQETVWRVVDSCRMIGVVNFGEEDASVVVEVKGDAFLPQQVRRIVGTSLAMSRGWIPSDAWGNAFLDPTCVMETILAPPGRLYLADCRFHFEESRSSGKSIFESAACGRVLTPGQDSNDPHKWAQEQLLQSLSSERVKSTEDQWLKDVRDTISPRIRQSLDQALNESPPLLVDDTALDPAPSAYLDVLTKLRTIVSEGRWPGTSMARSAVIRNTHKNTNEIGKAGSFTVINTKLKEKLQSPSGDPVILPLANQLFPELAAAVFDLEDKIADQAQKAQVTSDGEIMMSSECSSGRRQSTHCAVNCNAQFTAHVDSGRGAGQSLSVIVGLGDYHKGELMVEGLPCDIRYKPLEFDGWSLRHWTSQYSGERFSLVWFTPELK